MDLAVIRGRNGVIPRALGSGLQNWITWSIFNQRSVSVHLVRFRLGCFEKGWTKNLFLPVSKTTFSHNWDSTVFIWKENTTENCFFLFAIFSPWWWNVEIFRVNGERQSPITKMECCSFWENKPDSFSWDIFIAPTGKQKQVHFLCVWSSNYSCQPFFSAPAHKFSQNISVICNDISSKEFRFPRTPVD